MNPHPNPAIPSDRPVRLAALLSILLVMSVGGRAQQVAAQSRAEQSQPPLGEEGVIVLSPFEVTTDTFGYEARDTLSGSRINAKLKDLPNSISVLTPEFLADTGATTPQEAFKYSLNVENSREYTDVANPAAFTGVNFNDFGGRIRGISFGGRTRDFFDTVFEEDMYNLERITISSGPNAVIYGLGGTAGIINTSFKEANTNRDQLQLNLRYDSEGSRRGVVDVSQKGLRGLFAVRAIAMEDRNDSFRMFGDGKQSRQFLSMVFRPFRDTKIRGYYEKIDIKKLLPRNVAAYDGGYSTYLDKVAKGASRDIDNSLRTIPAEWAGLVERRNDNRVLWVYDRNGGTNLGQAAGTNNLWSFQTVEPHRLAVLASDRFQYSLPQGLQSKEYNLHGATAGREQYGDIWGVIANHSFGKNFAVEIGYNEEKGWTDFYDMGWPTEAVVRVDMNRYLPNLASLKPNPYVGMPYVEGTAQNTQELNHLRGFRVSATYTLDLNRQNPWLGRHSLVGLYNADRTDRYWAWTRTRTVPAGTAYRYDARGTLAAGQTVYRMYVDPQTGKVMEVSFDQLNGGPQPDGSYVYGLRNAPATGQTFSSLQKRDGFMTALQSFLLKDRLVTTLGYRKMGFQNGTAVDGNTVRTNHPNYAYGFPHIAEIDHSLDSYGPRTKGDALSYGAVYHLTTTESRWGGLSLYYNWADIFNQSPENYYADGSRIPPSIGEGFDLGLMYQGLDNRLSVRLNYYQTTTANTLTTAWAPNIRNNITNMEYTIGGPKYANRSYWTDARDGLLPSGHPAFQDHFNFELAPGVYFMTADRDAKGIEMEVFFKPTRNWDFRATLARNEATDTNAGKGWNEYVLKHYEYYRAWAAWEATAYRPGGTTPISKEANSVTTRFSNFAPAFVTTESSNGLRVAQNAGWRMNLTSKYTFTGGLLNRFHVGTHLRYREAPIIGYLSTQADNPFKNFPGLATSAFYAPNINQPVTYKDLFDVDLFLGHHGSLFRGKIKYNARCNVNNVLNEGGINAQRADGLGAVRIYNFKTPRLFVFALDLSY